MKKYLIGFLAGVAVTAAGSAYADEIQTLVGKTIEGQFPVKIEGKQLDARAAVVDGTSYLPVRAIGEALNMDVKFDSDLGIELTQKGDAPVAETNQTQAEVIITQTNTNQVSLDDLKSKIANENESIKSAEQLIEANKNSLNDPNVPKEEVQKFIDMYNQKITEAKQRIADYEKQLADLEAQQ